jgi:hypothetical protein
MLRTLKWATTVWPTTGCAGVMLTLTRNCGFCVPVTVVA